MNIFELRQKCTDLINTPLTEDSCKEILEIIRFIGEDDGDGDDEVAHSLEDKFREAVLKSIDHPLAKLALKTSEFYFARWCA